MMHAKRIWLSLMAALGCMGQAQCTAPMPSPGFLSDGEVDTTEIDPQFRDGLGHLATAQSWAITAEPPAYDWVLLGVRAQWEGAERVWFVRVVETVDPEEAEGGRRLRDRRFQYTLPFGVGQIKPDAKFNVRCRRIRVETYDANGEFVAAWSRLSPEIFANASMFQALEALPSHGPINAAAAPTSQDGAEQAAKGAATQEAGSMSDRGVYELIVTLQTLGTTPPMAPVRDVVKDHIVAVPSILSLVMTGLKPTATASIRNATGGQFPWVFDGVMAPCYQTEFTTYFAGERCFDCRLVVGPSVPPMHLLGGLLVIEAAHPRLPENRLTARVLATSRARPVG